MTIRQLPPDIQILAMENARIQGELYIGTNLDTGLNAAFNWSKTPQGHQYWSTLYRKGTEEPNDDQIIM